MRFDPPTIAQRGQLVRLRAEVQGHKPQHGEQRGKLRCVCGATLQFNIQSTGLSRALCAAGCGVRWSN